MYALIPLLVILVGVTAFGLFLVLTEYKPEAEEDSIVIRKSKFPQLQEPITLTTYNIGYACLDRDSDFFMDGGTATTRITYERTLDNLIGITHQLQDLDSDIFCLQEVDTAGSRSNNINELEHMATELFDYNVYFAYDYRAKWVPFPIFHPLGSAHSGLAVMSKYRLLSSKRIALDGQELFPRSLFLPKRCMVVNELALAGSKKLYIVNTHLSAYDKDGLLRRRQFNDIIRYCSELYDGRSNYVIITGDFNLLMDDAKRTEDDPAWVDVMPQSLHDSKFKVVYDKTQPSVRSLDKPYIKDINFETYIDGFLVSPNIDVVDVTTHDFQYRFSDHNPSTLTFRLK